MVIWVDADACPRAVKEILYRAANRTMSSIYFVANSWLELPASPYIHRVIVGQGFDVADRHIISQVKRGDLVITADIPLAAEIVEQGALALNPRGELYTTNNIKQRLAARNNLEQLRGAGVILKGQESYSEKEKAVFANALDRLLAKR